MVLSFFWRPCPDTLLDQLENRRIFSFIFFEFFSFRQSRNFWLVQLFWLFSYRHTPSLKSSTNFRSPFLDEFVAQFKSTLLLLPNGTVLATGIPVDLNLYESEHSVTDEELVKILAESPNLVSGGGSSSSKNKKKKKKAAGAASEGADKENSKETATENKA
jgi:hypothetical protein